MKAAHWVAAREVFVFRSDGAILAKRDVIIGARGSPSGASPPTGIVDNPDRRVDSKLVGLRSSGEVLVVHGEESDLVYDWR